MYATMNTPWYAAGLRTISNFLTSIAEDFERKAEANRIYQIDDYQVEERLARYRLDAQIGYMSSEPRYF